jgi:hypothetical protein
MVISPYMRFFQFSINDLGCQEKKNIPLAEKKHIWYYGIGNTVLSKGGKHENKTRHHHWSDLLPAAFHFLPLPVL